MKLCNNAIVQTCFNHAVENSCSPLGHNIAFFRDIYSINIVCSNVQNCLNVICSPNLNLEENNLVAQLKILLSAKSGAYYINGFSYKDIDTLIQLIATQ